jgi:hypothetical protein
MYLVQTTFCLLLAWLLYEALLRRETFFQLNRLYLLLMPLLALAIPCWHFSMQRAVVLPTIVPIVEQSMIVQNIVYQPFITQNSVFELSYGTILWIIFSGGLVLKLIQLAHSLWQTTRLIRRCQQRQQQGGVILLEVNEMPVASFFSYVFWNKKQTIDHQEFLLQHELVHVRQWHSFDVLLMEVLVAVQWFNPIIYFFRNRLRETHEFIADEYVVRQTGQRYQYAAVLVQQCAPLPASRLVHTFSSLTKQRLIMLTLNRSSLWKASKYLLSVPLVGFFVLLFSFNLMATLPLPLPQVAAFIEQLNAKPVFEKQPTSVLSILPISQTINDLAPPTQAIPEANYIFYWGKLQLNYKPSEDGTFFGANTAIPENQVYDLLHNTPSFWNGTTIEYIFSFQLTYIDNDTKEPIIFDFDLKKDASDYNPRRFSEIVMKFRQNQVFYIDNIKTATTGNTIFHSTVKINERQGDTAKIFIRHDEITNIIQPKLDFKWGKIGVHQMALTKFNKKDFIESLVNQPVAFDRNGVPIKTIDFRVTRVPKNGDPSMVWIKSDLIEPKLFQSCEGGVNFLTEHISAGDIVYFDDINAGEDGRFSLVFEIGE